jgi:hypothetical protein
MKFLLPLILILLNLPGFCQEDDEEFIRGAEASRQKHLELVHQIEKTKDAFNVADELKKLGYDTINGASLMDEKVIAVVKRALRENHMSHFPREVVADLIMEKSQGHYMEKVFRSNPWLLDATVDVMRDREALPALLDLLLKKESLKLYMYFWLGILLLSFIVKRFIFPKSWKGFKRHSLGFLLSFFLMIVSLTVFYNMFRPNLRPTLSILYHRWSSRT